VHIFGIEYIF